MLELWEDEGRTYARIINFKKHQKLRWDKTSKIPMSPMEKAEALANRMTTEAAPAPAPSKPIEERPKAVQPPSAARRLPIEVRDAAERIWIPISDAQYQQLVRWLHVDKFDPAWVIAAINEIAERTIDQHTAKIVGFRLQDYKKHGGPDKVPARGGRVGVDDEDRSTWPELPDLPTWRDSQ
jgi:hypothetical protein